MARTGCRIRAASICISESDISVQESDSDGSAFMSGYNWLSLTLRGKRRPRLKMLTVYSSPWSSGALESRRQRCHHSRSRISVSNGLNLSRAPSRCRPIDSARPSVVPTSIHIVRSISCTRRHVFSLQWSVSPFYLILRKGHINVKEQLLGVGKNGKKKKKKKKKTKKKKKKKKNLTA